MNDNNWMQRTHLLMGDEGMEQLGRARVIRFGVGGVGSWCDESLVRTGISHLTIVDSDCVAPSNLNRQLMATSDTIGEPKVEALRERLLSINPNADIVAIKDIFTEETAHRFQLDTYDYIIDAIDSLRDKALLIRLATASGARFFSSMGAALKMDPTRIRVTEFWKVTGDPLARALRNIFKRSRQFPARKFQCVFSDELLQNKEKMELEENQFHKVHANGSIAHITAIFGLTLAGLVVQDIYTFVSPST